MKNIQSIRKNTVVLSVMGILTIVFGFGLNIAITRYLGDVAFGKYTFALALTSISSIILDFGFNQLTIREVSRDKSLNGMYLGNILVMKILLSIVFLGFIYWLITLMGYPSDTKLIVSIIAIYTVFASFNQLFKSSFRAFEKMEYDAISTIIEKSIIALIGILLLVLGFDLIYLVLLYVLSSFVSLLISFILLSTKIGIVKFDINLDYWKSMIYKAIPFGLTSFFVLIYVKIDTVMISFIMGDAPVGWYSAAVSFIVGISFIPSVLIGSIFPVFSRLHVESKTTLIDFYEKAFKYLFIIVFPIGVGTTILADKFVLLVYGQQFTNSIIVLKILIWWHVLGSLNWLSGTILQSTNNQRAFAVSTCVCAFINIVLNLYFIPTMGYIGASLTTIITEIVSFMLLYRFVSMFLYRLPILENVAKTIVSGLVMGIAVYLLKSYSLFPVILIAVLIYFSTLIITKGFSKADLKIILTKK